MASTSDSGTSKVAPEVGEKYREILKQNGITEPISEVIVKDAGLQGEGFASQSSCVTVKFKNPEVAQLNLFVKGYTINATHTELITGLKAFEKEARFLMEYVPAARELCKLKGLENLLDIYPKCYFGDDKLIVLENLVLDKGYGLQNKKDPQGMEEARAALLTLAKHHAISYAMIQKYGGREKFLEAFQNFDFCAFEHPQLKSVNDVVISNAVKNFSSILQDYPVKGGENALEWLNTEGKKALKDYLEPFKYDPEEEPIFVLNHGDYWSNNMNMMFLKDEDGNLLNHITIDFQLVLYNLPIVDLGYYFFTSVKGEVRKENIKHLLSFYLDQFKNISGELGHHIELSFEELFLQFRKRFKHGFWIGFSWFLGPGQVLFKDVNLHEIGGTSDLATGMDKAFNKWIKENPSKCEKFAKDIVSIIEDYNELRTD